MNKKIVGFLIFGLFFVSGFVSGTSVYNSNFEDIDVAAEYIFFSSMEYDKNKTNEIPYLDRGFPRRPA